MADSESWQELADKFRAIQLRSSTTLFLEWQRTYGARSELRWKPLHDVNRGRTLYLEFMLLAHEAGAAHDKTSLEPVRTWMEAIIQRDVANNPLNQRNPIGPESTPEGEVWHQPGRIQDLCSASVDLCLELAILSRENSERAAILFSIDAATPAFPEEARADDPVIIERLVLLADFMRRGRVQGIRKITEPMITQAANPGNWNGRTQIGWWKRNNKGCNAPCDRKIRALLKREPRDIWPDKIPK